MTATNPQIDLTRPARKYPYKFSTGNKCEMLPVGWYHIAEGFLPKRTETQALHGNHWSEVVLKLVVPLTARSLVRALPWAICLSVESLTIVLQHTTLMNCYRITCQWVNLTYVHVSIFISVRKPFCANLMSRSDLYHHHHHDSCPDSPNSPQEITPGPCELRDCHGKVNCRITEQLWLNGASVNFKMTNTQPLNFNNNNPHPLKANKTCECHDPPRKMADQVLDSLFERVRAWSRKSGVTNQVLNKNAKNQKHSWHETNNNNNKKGKRTK